MCVFCLYVYIHLFVIKPWSEQKRYRECAAKCWDVDEHDKWWRMSRKPIVKYYSQLYRDSQAGISGFTETIFSSRGDRHWWSSVKAVSYRVWHPSPTLLCLISSTLFLCAIFLLPHLTFPSHSFPLLLLFNLICFPIFFIIELLQESVPNSTHNSTVVVSAAGVMPYLQGRGAGTGGGDQNLSHSVSTTPSASSSSCPTSCDRQPAPPGTMGSAQPQGQTFSLGISNSGLGPPPPKPPGGGYTSSGHHSSSDGNSLTNMVSIARCNNATLFHSFFFLHARSAKITLF